MLRALAMTIGSLFVGLAAGDDDAPKVPKGWKEFAPQDNAFTVWIPANPRRQLERTRTATINGIKLKVTLLHLEMADTFVYQVETLTVPATLLTKLKRRELENELKEVVLTEFRGRLAEETDAKLGAISGKDYLVETGKGQARVRIFIGTAGRVVALFVEGARDQVAKKETTVFLDSFRIATGKPEPGKPEPGKPEPGKPEPGKPEPGKPEPGKPEPGKPEPEPTGKDLKGWGVAIDLDNDCTFRPESTRLTLEVPGTWHDLSLNTKKVNAPRVVKTVDGDFSLTVKVTGDFKPGGKSTNPKGVPYNGGGIVVWHNTDNFIRLERGALLRNGKVGSLIAFEERQAGNRGAVNNQVYPGGTCYLRMERKGSRFMGATSFDGKAWKELAPIDTFWPSDLKVGLLAINSNSEPFSVRFEEYSLKTKEPAKK